MTKPTIKLIMFLEIHSYYMNHHISNQQIIKIGKLGYPWCRRKISLIGNN